MGFFQTEEGRFLKAIDKGNIPLLRQILKQHPEYLEKTMFRKSIWLYHSEGAALNMAVYYKQPEVIKFFVTECGADINLVTGDKLPRGALHYACLLHNLESAKVLIELGADKDLKAPPGNWKPMDLYRSLYGEGGIEDFARLFEGAAPVKKEKLIEEKPVGVDSAWTRSSDSEVVHDRKMPGNGYQITDIFNFEGRYWKSISYNQETRSTTQETFFFDALPDTQAVHQAHAKYAELGGQIPASIIDRRILLDKPSA